MCETRRSARVPSATGVPAAPARLGRLPGDAATLDELDHMIFPNVAAGGQHRENVTDAADTLPSGRLNQVVVAVPPWLLRRIGDAFEDRLKPGRDIPTRADDARNLIITRHSPIESPDGITRHAGGQLINRGLILPELRARGRLMPAQDRRHLLAGVSRCAGIAWPDSRGEPGWRANEPTGTFRRAVVPAPLPAREHVMYRYPAAALASLDDVPDVGDGAERRAEDCATSDAYGPGQADGRESRCGPDEEAGDAAAEGCVQAFDRAHCVRQVSLVRVVGGGPQYPHRVPLAERQSRPRA